MLFVTGLLFFLGTPFLHPHGPPSDRVIHLLNYIPVAVFATSALIAVIGLLRDRHGWFSLVPLVCDLLGIVILLFIDELTGMYLP